LEKFGKPTVGSIPTIIRTYKSYVTRGAGRELHIFSIWQRGYYEHILRDDADYLSKSSYILENPVNWEKDEENPDLTAPGR
jgi:hypothetical protein